MTGQVTSCLTRDSRRLGRLGNLKCEDETPPLDLGLLKINEQTEGQAGGSQIVKTLRHVFVGEAFGTFQLHHQHVLDKQIGKVFSPRVTLVGNGFSRNPAPSVLETSNTAPSTFSLKEFRSVLSAKPQDSTCPVNSW